MLKRVIGLPGETVQIKEGHIYINGSLLENDINDTYIVTAGITANEIHLAEDEYFCLGDNRNNSEDSRFSSIGMVKKKSMLLEKYGWYYSLLKISGLSNK